MSLTVAVVVISSPATTGAPHANSWPPWTIIAKLIPTSGSKIAGAIARRAVDDREHRRRHDVGVAGGARRLDVEVERVGLADRARVLPDLLPADRVVAGGKVLPIGLGLDGHAARQSIGRRRLR